ncbi:hypothetical protein CIK05_07505 [Bdellovibrio sp. qaytius]|nr:hypothetical protein CIK05_07505 [Bdellovibrio sp. qaytius]
MDPQNEVDKIQDLEIQLKIALQALSFYADPESYGQGESFAELSRISDSDLEHKPANRGYDTVGGKLARKALLEIKDKEERLASRKIKKAGLWNKQDSNDGNYFSVRIEFQDSSKEWIKLFPSKTTDDQAPEFSTREIK